MRAGKATFHIYGTKTVITITNKVGMDTTFPFKDKEKLVAEINGGTVIISKPATGPGQARLEKGNKDGVERDGA